MHKLVSLQTIDHVPTICTRPENQPLTLHTLMDAQNGSNQLALWVRTMLAFKLQHHAPFGTRNNNEYQQKQEAI